MIVGSAGTMPATPALPTAAHSASGTDAPFVVGEVYKYVVQAVNIAGITSASPEVSFTIGTANRAVEITITNVANAEHYLVFRTPVESSVSGMQMFVGKIIPTRGSATTIFRDKNGVIPGLDSVLFLPKDKHRAKLAILGNLLNKMDLGVTGSAVQSIYVSYVGCVVDRPRSFSLVDNVYQVREGL